MARALVAAADTYAYDPRVSDAALLDYWTGPAVHGFVADDGRVRGCFRLVANHPGPGSHVANASYVVHPDSRGRGVGRAMGERSLALARGLGFEAMQFNIVVASNASALALWRKLGFSIVGTVPRGFRRPGGGFDDFHVMHRFL